MQVIEKMEDEQFEAICDAGVEIFRQLVTLLQQRGLGLEHATAVIAVAAAGVAKGSRVSSENLLAAIDAAANMWRTERRGEDSGIIFDPAHRRDGYEPPARDASQEN